MSNLYTIVCRDKPGSKSIRMEKLAEHLAHVTSVIDRIKIAAPLRDEGEEEFTGSLLVVTANDLADAHAFLEADPYFKAGIWREVVIDRLGFAAGEWVGGITW